MCSKRTCESPEPLTTLVFVAADVDRSATLYKTLQKQATIVECWGLKGAQGREGSTCGRSRGRREALVRQAVADAGQQIDPAAARLIAERAGTDIATLRGDVDRLLLYAAGKPKIDAEGCPGSRQCRDGAGRLGGDDRDPARQHGRSAAPDRAGARVRRRALQDPRTARVVRAGEAAGHRSAAGAGGRSKRCSERTWS